MNVATRIVTVLAVSVLVLSGCSDGGSGDRGRSAAPSSSASTESPGSTQRQSAQPPTRFADQGHDLRWPKTGGMSESHWAHLETLTMHGDLAITYGQSTPGVLAFDMTTGDARWRFPVKHAADVGGENRTSKIVNINGEPTLFAVFRITTPADGTTPSSEKLRLYALNLQGEKLWQADIPESDGLHLGASWSDVVAANEEYVVVHSTADSNQLGTTVVFSVPERKPVWHREHFTGVAVRDGIVVGNGRDETKKMTEDRRQLAGLRATDGSPAWTSTEAKRIVVSTDAYRMNGGGNWLPAVRGESWKDGFGVVEATTASSNTCRCGLIRKPATTTESRAFARRQTGNVTTISGEPPHA